MKVEKLKGHSGCELFLCRGARNNFVRKISPNQEYNRRLIEQCKKQTLWKNDISSVPEVINTGYIEGLFYFDMEYVLGSTISSLLTENQIDIDEIIEFVIAHYKIQFKEKKDAVDLINVYSKKIKQFDEFKNKYPLIKNLDQALELLNNNFIIPKYTSNVHGDMTLENLIKSKKDNKIYMIDFLDDFSNSLYTDLSKIFQDIQGGWSFFDRSKNTPISGQSNLSVRLLDMRKKIINEIREIDNNERFFEGILYILLINYIRIIPYIKNNHVYLFIDLRLEETIKLIENNDLTFLR
jgi:tRNA A-37 threonylcarbamoyl transferase component Bud32